MKLRIVLLSLSVAALCSAQYSYDYSENPVISDNNRWVSNGSPSFTSTGVTFSGVGGSLISAVPISVESGGSQNDYEVNTTLALNSGGGTYIHFLRTSSNTVEAGSGSYESVELVIPSGFAGTSAATLNFNQCTNGAVTLLGSATITATNGMTLRTVVFGGSIWVFVNNLMVWSGSEALTSGNPGIGGYSIPSGSGFASIKLGHHDTVPPFQVGPHAQSSVFPNSVSLQWQGVVDDSNGVGVYCYTIHRNNSWIGLMPTPAIVDSTVQPGTTYTYRINALDYHGNLGAPTNVTITTPPAGAVDPRRTGLYSNGSYWGGGGEQIDTLSGNLHFSVPLLTARRRTGWTIPVNLVYDSQNWRQDNGVNWQLGTDVGYGFGWKALIGSITPYYPNYWAGTAIYVYTDGTGAQYRLDQNNGGVWTSSTQTVYVWLDTTVSPNVLHFKDGSFWTLGSTSGGTEQDAGTMYPTIIEDRFGNQVIVTYDTGAGLPFAQVSGYAPYISTPNTSSRIVGIDDVRGQACTLNNYSCNQQLYGGMTAATYLLTYDHADYAIPHLTSYKNFIQTGESGTFTYTTTQQEPPFGTDASYSGSSAVLLTSMTTPWFQPWQFTYDTAGAGELMSVIVPYGGEISWNYDTFQYIGSRSLREVSARFLAPDSAHATSPPWTYGISRPDAPNSVTVHSAMTLTDASGVGAKTWKFNTTGPSAWQIGLASEFTQLTAANGAVLQDDTYTWSQDPGGRPYISAKTSVTGQNTGNPQSALSTQTVDQYGNTTQMSVYPYNNTSTPLQTYNNTYIHTSQYMPYYIFNLLSTSKLTTSAGQVTVMANTFDPPSPGTPVCGSNLAGGTVCSAGWYTGTQTAPTTEYDPNSPIPHTSKAILSTTATNSKATAITYYNYGGVQQTLGSDGTVSTASASAATNYAAPQSITVQNYNEALSYNAWGGVTGVSGQNGESLSQQYDLYGRPSVQTSPYGAVTNTGYTTTAPYAQIVQGPYGVTTTTVDGFGRTVRVASGDTNGVHSYVDTAYAPCACSPLGKQWKVSQPYPSGSSASNWTIWSYDGLGRTLSVQQPDGASHTTYSYSGNASTVTDPAGNSKTFTSDVLGNLLAVAEPDPCVPGSTLTTSYAYDWMSHVSGVTMARPNASYASNGVCSEIGSPTTQTRTFVYDGAGRLSSATNPENGTVTYSYNTDSTLFDKHDAKGQDTIYYYDSLRRVIQTQQWPQGYAPGKSADPCATVNYTYDTNPVNPSFSQYSTGRLTTAQYFMPSVGNQNSALACYVGNGDWYTEMYSYHPAGGVIAKNFTMSRQYNGTSGSASLEVDYTFDTAGRTATVTYPMTFPNFQGNQPVLTYAYDSMGRASTLTDAAGDLTWAPTSWATASYDYAGRLGGIGYITGPINYYRPPNAIYQTASTGWGYNASGQLSAVGWYMGNSSGGVQYVYPAANNNGQVTQAIDTWSGETISYQYDSLKRLIAASSTPNTGSSTSPWNQSYEYDGFGNMVGKSTNGTLTTIQIDPTKNQVANGYYDANGNGNSGHGLPPNYDVANRLGSVYGPMTGGDRYGYDSTNKRVYRFTSSLQEEFTFYGAKGEKLGIFGIQSANCTQSSCGIAFTPEGTSIWFAGRLILDTGNGVLQDRVGTNRAKSSSLNSAPVARYYPYGDEITSTSNDRVKFGTYTRDADTGLDYADQRYYYPGWGSFMTPDPSMGSAVPSDPGSWNKYFYASHDPVNRFDPQGLEDSSSTGEDDYADCYLVADASACGGWGLATSPNIQVAKKCAIQAAIMAFGSGPVPDPACEQYAPIIPVAAPAAATCSITLEERPVDVPGVSLAAQHTYLYIQDASGAETVEGGPSYSGPGFPNLVGTVSAPPGNGLGIGANATNPSLSSNKQIGFAYAGTFACLDAQEIDSIVGQYDKGGKQVSYNPVPALGPGYNSNSFTWTLLLDVGLSSYYGSVGFAPGWGYVVPGLHQ